VPPGVPPVIAPPGWNDPPVLKNSSRTQVCKHNCMSLCCPFFFQRKFTSHKFLFASQFLQNRCTFIVLADGDNQPLKYIYFFVHTMDIVQKINFLNSHFCLL
jgi:hypothetical protein